MRIVAVLLTTLMAASAVALDPREPLSAYGQRVWTTDNGLPQNTVRSVKQSADGFLWLETEDGPVRFDGVEFRPGAQPATSQPSISAAAEVGQTLSLPEGMGTVRVSFTDHEGTIWAGCDGGLARQVGGRVEVLRGSAVLALMEDREGNLWAGTEAEGLMELHEQAFQTFGVEEGLGGNVVRTVIEDARGTVWVGTDGGGLARRVGGRFAVVPGLSSNVVLALAAAGNGDVWAGTPTGLNRLRDGKVKVMAAADGLADDYVRSVLVDWQGSVWVGTRHGLTRIALDGAMRTYTALDGLGSDFIGAMKEGADGALWVGTSSGLARFDGRRFRNLTTRDGLVSDVVTAMLPLPEGGMLLGHDGLGLSLLRDGSDRRIGAGRLPETIFGILRDAAGKIWVSSRSGIFRWDGVRAAAFDTADGLRVREASRGGHPAAMRAGDGTLWFATLRGVSVVDPERLHENAVPPLVAVESVLVNDREVDSALTGEVVVPAGQRRVEFGYAGLSFVAPGKVRYRYRLDGFDKKWVEAGARRTAFYTNLRPGQYVFRVMAANNDGVWSSGAAEVRLRLLPFFWETVWFYLLLLLTAAGVAYLAYARRVRRVEARYAGAMEERGRIAREIHDGLAQSVVSISVQLEVALRLLNVSVESARGQLEATRSLVRQTLAEARSSIWELRAGPGEAEELPTALGRALKEVTANSAVAGRLTVAGSYRRLAPDVEEELLRIAREAVTNAVRHSGGTAVEVVLAYEMTRLRLFVRDDGRGFDAGAQSPAGHYGVQGMRERAAKIGAALAVQSAAAGGTEIAVELALV